MIVYLIVSWAVIQGADILFENLPVPDGSTTLVIILVVAGFPLAIVLAWAYELSPSGLIRDPGAHDFAPTNGQPIAKAPVAPDASIAVLAFADMSPDRDQGYFCDGVAEEILNTLVQIKDLHVASRTSSFRFKGQAVDISEIARQLRVQTVLEGSVRKAGDKLRITAQLIDAADGFHLWSASYDRDMKDIFSIQDEIAGNIADALKVNFAPSKSTSTSNIEAYDYYLQGRNFFHRTGPKNMSFAREMFCKAIALDNGFAMAWAGLADSYGYEYLYYRASKENRDECSQASQKALELAPDLAEAHASRGFAHSICKEFDKAETEFEEAIRINPNLFEAYYLYARSAVHAGNLSKSAELFEKASQVRPLDYQSLLLVAPIYGGLGMSDEAQSAAERGVAAARKALELMPGETRALYLGAGGLLRLDKRDEAFRWADRAVFVDADDPSVLYNIACFYSQAGDIERALDCLEQANLPGMANKSWVTNDADLNPLRSHPRYKTLLEQLSD